MCVNGHVKCTQQSHTHVQCSPYLLSCMPVGVATTNLPMSKRKRDIRAYFEVKGTWFRVCTACVGNRLVRFVSSTPLLLTDVPPASRPRTVRETNPAETSKGRWFGHVGLVALVRSRWFGHVGLVALVWSRWFGRVGLVALVWPRWFGRVG